MIRLLSLLVLMVLSSCGRPMTPNEIAFSNGVLGKGFDPAGVRFHDGHWANSFSFQRPVRPRTTCMERIFPPQEPGITTTTPGAIAVFNHVFYRDDLYAQDFLGGYPERMSLYHAMLLAHEMTHVWQWQNRQATGYTPLRAINEHSPGGDPYLFDLETKKRFHDYGYEQQGAIVEEFVCCRALDPDAPRTRRLGDLLQKAFGTDAMLTSLPRPKAILPWSGAETGGICR